MFIALCVGVALAALSLGALVHSCEMPRSRKMSEG